MKQLREYTKKEIAKKEQFYIQKGATKISIYNPIIKVGKFKANKLVLYKGKKYIVHSFSEDVFKKKAIGINILLLTKEGKIDNRAIGICAPINSPHLSLINSKN